MTATLRQLLDAAAGSRSTRASAGNAHLDEAEALLDLTPADAVARFGSLAAARAHLAALLELAGDFEDRRAVALATSPRSTRIH
jgi:hypothetical protein